MLRFWRIYPQKSSRSEASFCLMKLGEEGANSGEAAAVVQVMETCLATFGQVLNTGELER